MSRLRQLSRNLRNNPTEAEKRLWRFLRGRQLCGLKFRRQFPVDKYIVDFACLERRVVVELDGGQHDERRLYDEERTRVIEAGGFLVLRFWNDDVFTNIEGVLADIVSTIDFPPPKGEG